MLGSCDLREISESKILEFCLGDGESIINNGSGLCLDRQTEYEIIRYEKSYINAHLSCRCKRKCPVTISDWSQFITRLAIRLGFARTLLSLSTTAG